MQQPDKDSIKAAKTRSAHGQPVTEQTPLIDGTTVIEDEVVASIAGFAAGKVKGVESLGKSSIASSVIHHIKSAEDNAGTGVKVEVGKREAIINLELNVMYGYYIPDIVDEVRSNVASSLMEITGLMAKEINIRIVGIKFSDTKRKTG